MSGLNSGDRKDYSKYDKMSTESLEELLRLDAELPDGEGSDIDEILYISEVIAKRDREQPTGRYSEADVDAAWETFQTKYLPYAADGRSLYDFDDDEPGSTKAITPDMPSPSGKKRISARGRRRLGRLASIAAAIALLIGIMTVTAYAMGYDLWGVIAQWTKDTFTFVPISENNRANIQTKDDDFANLQMALDEFGVTTQLVPTWIPDGFILDDIVVDDTTMEDSITFQANYVNNEKYLTIYINMYDTADNVNYSAWEKDDHTVTELSVGGITFYIVENDSEPLAIWSNGQFECFISGNISTDDLIKIIRSIYEKG